MNQIVYEGMFTPWGTADQVELVTDHIGHVMTPSHGGVRVSHELNRKIPAKIRREDGWYEEDCEWAIPFYFLKDHIRTECINLSRDHSEKLINSSESTLKNWFPDEFESATGIKVKPEESHQVRERIFHEQNRGKLMVTSAVGDWHAKVPKGMVGVCAREDGGYYPESLKVERYFFVPAIEYKNKKSIEFIIDTERHTETERFF